MDVSERVHERECERELNGRSRYTFFFIVKIFSYQLNVDTNVHIYIFCNKHFRCLQLHFIYKAYPYILCFIFSLFFSHHHLSFCFYTFFFFTYRCLFYQLIFPLLFTITITAILLLYCNVYYYQTQSRHPL